MKIKNISETKLTSLQKLNLPNDILNTESEILIFDSKDKWSKNKKVFKKLYINEGETFSNKLYTINEEIDKKEEINMEELIFADKLVSIKGQIAGFTMPYIENINFKTFLSSNEFTVKEKLARLKEVGEILEKLKKVRKYTSVSNIYINDLHTSNFILNTKTSKINVVDTDSFKIGNNMASSSKYLSQRSPIFAISKYKQNPNPIGGIYEINENTELFCYIVMIFDYIFKDKITDLKISDYYMYLEYLSHLGVSNELLDKFALIYLGQDNENPYEYIEQLEEYYGRTSNLAFKAARKRFFY